MRSIKFAAIRVGILCVITLAGAAAAPPDDAQTYTATATIKTAGGASATAPVTVVVRQFATDAQRDELMAALKKGGTASAREVLAKRTDIGTVQLGSRQVPIKHAYTRRMGEGQLVTVVTDKPILFVGGGVPESKPTAGYDLGLVMLEVGTGPGSGELVPATKVKMDAQGAVVTEDYSGEVVRLSNVVKK